MARLTAARRRTMKKGQFALSGRRFPINDAKHARLAISGASRAYHAGNISRAQRDSIDRKARAKLHRGSRKTTR